MGVSGKLAPSLLSCIFFFFNIISCPSGVANILAIFLEVDQELSTPGRVEDSNKIQIYHTRPLCAPRVGWKGRAGKACAESCNL